MGMDFSCLMQYKFSVERYKHICNTLERNSLEAMQAVAASWRQAGFFRLDSEQAAWQTAAEKIVNRPSLPCLETSLVTPENFILTFGYDAIHVYHTLRWRTFLTEPAWQDVMLNACNALAELVDAREGIITRDESPVYGPFYDGANYRESLDAAQGRDGEVARASDMYVNYNAEGTWDSFGYWRFLGRKP